MTIETTAAAIERVMAAHFYGVVDRPELLDGIDGPHLVPWMEACALDIATRIANVIDLERVL